MTGTQNRVGACLVNAWLDAVRVTMATADLPWQSIRSVLAQEVGVSYSFNQSSNALCLMAKSDS